MPPKYKFLFTEDLVARREWCLQVVYTLGDAEHCNMGTVFDPTATHVIVGSLRNSTTLFCGLAAGKWIIHVKFLEHSQAKGHWLDPGDYEVGSFRGHELDPEHPNFFVNAPQRCREEVLVRMKPLLATWNVGVLIHSFKSRRSVRWILKAGGAEVKVIQFPVQKDNPPKVDWIFTECPSRKLLEGVSQWAIPLIPLSYLVDFLLKGHTILNRLTYPLRDCIHVNSFFLTRKCRQSFRQNISVPQRLTKPSVVEDDAKMHDVSKRRLSIPRMRRKSRKLESDENSPVLQKNSNCSVPRLCLKGVVSLHWKSNRCEEIKDRPLAHLTISNNVTVEDTPSLSFSSVCLSKNADIKCCAGGINGKSKINLSEDITLSVESNVSVEDTSLLLDGVCSEGNVDQESCVQHSVNNQGIDLHNGSSAIGSDVLEDCSSKKDVNLISKQEFKPVNKELESLLPLQSSCSIQEPAKLRDESPCVNSEQLLSPQLSFTTNYSPHSQDIQVHSESHPAIIQLPPKRRCSESHQTCERVFEKHSRMRQSNGITSNFHSHSSSSTSFGKQNGRDAPTDDIIDLCSDDEFIEISSSDDDVAIVDASDHTTLAPTALHSNLCPTSAPSFLAPPYLCNPTRHSVHHLPASTPQVALDDDVVFVEGANLSANNIPRTSEVVHKNSLNQTELQQSFHKKLATSSVDMKSSTLHRRKISNGSIHTSTEIQYDDLLDSTALIEIDDNDVDDGVDDCFLLSPNSSILSIVSIHSEHCDEDVDIIPMKTDDLGSLHGSNAPLELEVVNMSSRTDNLIPFHRSKSLLELQVGTIPSQTDGSSPFAGSNTQSQLKVDNIPSKNSDLNPFHGSNTPSELEIENNYVEAEDLISLQGSNTTSKLEVENYLIKADDHSSFQGSDTLSEYEVENKNNNTDDDGLSQRSDTLTEFKTKSSIDEQVLPCERKEIEDDAFCNKSGSQLGSEIVPPIAAELESVIRNVRVALAQNDAEVKPVLKIQNIGSFSSNLRTGDVGEKGLSEEEEYPLTIQLSDSRLEPLENSDICGSLGCDTDVNMNLHPVIGNDKSGMAQSSLKRRNDDPCYVNDKGINGFSEFSVPTDLCNLHLNPPENVNDCVLVQGDAEVNANLDQVMGSGNGELIHSTSGSRNGSPLPDTDIITQRVKSRGRSHSSEYKRKTCSIAKKRRSSTNLSEVKSCLNSRKGKSRTSKICVEKGARSVLAYFGDTRVNERVKDKPISSLSNCTSSMDFATRNEIEENRVSQSSYPVVPVVEASTSSSERTAISAKDFRKIVHAYLTKFRSSPWLRMGASPQPPCTNSSTSCEDYHGEGKVGATELSRYFNQMMIELINDGLVLEAFQYCMCHMGRTTYPGVKVIRSMVYLILNTDDPDVLVSAQLVLKTLQELHPPCAYKMGAYYKQALLDSWTENEKEKSQSIFDDIISKLEEELNRRGEVNSPRPSVSAIVDTEDGIRWSFMDSDFLPVKHSYEDLSVSDRLQRLFIVFSFIVDVMESDLVVWLVKYGSCSKTLTELIKDQKQPLIASAIWTNTYSSIGSVPRICERLINLYLKGFTSHQAQVSFKTFHKMFALLIETMNAAEQRFPNEGILEYGQNCEKLAKKFLDCVTRADLYEDDLIYMLKSLKPAWLPFYLCDGLIRKKLFTKDIASLATMKRYVEDAYNILQKECRSQDLPNDDLPHEPKNNKIK